MELRAGYKKTEIGVIPEDWEVKTLKDVGEVKMCKRIFNVQTKEQGDIPFYKIGTFGKEADAFISKELYKEFRKKYSFPKVGDILVSAAGTIGRTLIYKGEDGYFQDSNIVWIENNDKVVSNKYLNFIYEVVNYRTEGGTIQRLYNNIIYSTPIICPPLPEQTAIAKVLSDTDNLLQALEKKIAKKRLIKQGAMQELLKPKEDWVQEILPKVCWYQEGPGLRNWQFTKKGMKVINVTNLVNGYLNLDKTDRHISMQEFEKMYKHFEIDDKDIVMASSGNSYSKVAVVRKQDLRLLMNTSVIRFKPMNGLDYNYLLIFLKSNLFKDQIDLLITGGAQPNFGPAHLKKIKIPLPSTKEEQTEIATILSDMNIEIENLEKQLAKYKQVKQGLMQNLLTGKIRLV